MHAWPASRMARIGVVHQELTHWNACFTRTPGTTSRDRAKVFLFLLARALARALDRSSSGRDVFVSIAGTTFCVGLTTDELATWREVYCDAVYDRVPSFI